VVIKLICPEREVKQGTLNDPIYGVNLEGQINMTMSFAVDGSKIKRISTRASETFMYFFSDKS
jgi:hypothetical protein